MTSATRPVWDFKYPEDDARWLLSRRIVRIEAQTDMGHDYQTESWVDLYDGSGEKRKFSAFPEYMVFRPGFGELLARSHIAERMRTAIAEADVWDKANAKELAEYERLKAKFEP